MIHPRNAAAVVDEQPVVFGFYVNWDPASLTSLRANLQHLTHLVPEWFTLLNGNGDLGDDRMPRSSGSAMTPTSHSRHGHQFP